MFRILQRHIPSTIPALLACEVLLLVTCFAASSYLMLDVDPEVYLLADQGLSNILIVTISVILGMYFQDMYSTLRVRNRTVLAQEICTALGMAFLLQSATNYALPNTMVPRWIMLMGSSFSLVSLFLFRGLYSRLMLGSIVAKRILFLGTNATAREIARTIGEHPELGMKTVGFVDQPGPDAEGLPGPAAGLAGTLEELDRVVEQTQAEKIVVGMAERRNQLPVYQLLEWKSRGVEIEEARQTYEKTHFRVSVKDLRPADLMFTDWVQMGKTTAQWLTFLSMVLALVGFILTLPLMLLVWLLVRLTSKGPALYAQTRSGLNGEPFRLYKFRSMRVDAEVSTGAVWASKNDPRITPLGRWLRKLRFDELPQFVNVLRGEMNLVGPRPERPEFVRTLQEQIPFYRQRLYVKPGLTGWAQINHKYGDTFEDTITKLEYDLYYIKHRTVSLDIYIMLQTVKVMLLHRGAQ